MIGVASDDGSCMTTRPPPHGYIQYMEIHERLCEGLLSSTYELAKMVIKHANEFECYDHGHNFTSGGICFYFKNQSQFSKNSASPESYVSVSGAGQENEGSGYEIMVPHSPSIFEFESIKIYAVFFYIEIGFMTT